MARRRVPTVGAGHPSAEWLTAAEAVALLQVRPATLYTYVSRGLLSRSPGPDGRTSRFSRAEVEKLRARARARRGHGPAAADALAWGEPVLETRISSLSPDGPAFRGIPLARLLADRVEFEQVAELLWSGRIPASPPAWPRPCHGVELRRLVRELGPGAAPVDRMIADLAQETIRHPEAVVLRGAGELELARSIMGRLAAALLGPGDLPRLDAFLAAGDLTTALASGLGVRAQGAARDALRVALVVLADHELTASTFVARVVASTGASLHGALVAALAAVAGPLHGGACARVEALLEELGSPSGVARRVSDKLRRGDRIPGFGHRLYPAGDPRFPPLFDAARRVPGSGPKLAKLEALVSAMDRAGASPPSADLGAVAIAISLGLGPGRATALFALGRASGWIAHALEQRILPGVLRPRARYTG